MWSVAPVSMIYILLSTCVSLREEKIAGEQKRYVELIESVIVEATDWNKFADDG